MPGRSVKKHPVTLNPTMQGEQQGESRKTGHVAGDLDMGETGHPKSLADPREVVAL